MWKRVIAPTALVSILWIAVSVPTTYYVNWLFEAHSRTMSEDVTTIEAAWAMRRDAWRLQVAVMEATQEDAANAKDEIERIEGTFLGSLAEARRTSLTQAEQALVETILQKFKAYRDHIRSQLQQRELLGPAVPTAAEREHTLRLAMAVTEACRQLSGVNEQLINAESERNKRLYESVQFARLGFLIIAPAVGLLLGWWVARRLNRSISQISVNLIDASGELGPEIGSVAVSTPDDLPALHRQVQVVADRIRKVVGELEETRKRALRSERLAAVGQLAAGVAHEIRNPLTSVKLLIQTASEREPSLPLSERQLEVVLQEISRMEAMIQSLLDFARPPRLRVVNHDLRQTVRRALNLIQGRAKHQSVAIIEEFPNAPVSISADPDQLHLVFGNLAINGVEAMANGGTLRVSIASDDGVCRVIFADTGPGIAVQLFDHLFEPFVTNKERGTGLGLAISRRIVEEHNGLLTAANRAEGGALFSVELRISDQRVVVSSMAETKWGDVPEHPNSETSVVV